MRWRGNAVSAVVVVAVLALSACSSDGDATPVATADDGTTTTSTTTVMPTASQTVPTMAPTTESPTTTLDPDDQLAAEVEAALLETFRLTDIAIQDPTNQAKVDAALAGYAEGNLTYTASVLEELRVKNRVARPNPETPVRYEIEKPARQNGSRADSAVIQVCEVDPWIVVEVGAGPDGGDAIVDPDVSAYRSVFVLELFEGDWRVVGSQLLGEWAGVAECQPE